MQYDMRQLERLTLDELRETAQKVGAKIKKSFTPQMIIYAILDAQADQKAAETLRRYLAEILPVEPVVEDTVEGADFIIGGSDELSDISPGATASPVRAERCVFRALAAAVHLTAFTPFCGITAAAAGTPRRR